jgi:hypothetical protein
VHIALEFHIILISRGVAPGAIRDVSAATRQIG